MLFCSFHLSAVCVFLTNNYYIEDNNNAVQFSLRFLYPFLSLLLCTLPYCYFYTFFKYQNMSFYRIVHAHLNTFSIQNFRIHCIDLSISLPFIFTINIKLQFLFLENGIYNNVQSKTTKKYL